MTDRPITVPQAEESEPQSLSTPAEAYPFVTVVMPIRNEAEFIRRSLGAVLNQKYPTNRMEIIIVDGMSEDGTRAVIEDLVQQWRERCGSKSDGHPPVDVIVLENPSRFVPAGLNTAIRKAKGEIIVRVDGHTVIEADYVSECVEKLNKTDAENVGGPMRALGEGYVAESIAVATSTQFGIGNSKFHYSNREQYVDTVYMGAYRKETLLRVGLFDETYVRHQDYELNYRLRKQGGKILLSPRIHSRYFVRSGLKKLWKQYYQYGVSKGRLLRQHPDSLRLRHAVPFLFLFFVVLGIILAILFPPLRPLLVLGVASYVGFLVLGTLLNVLNRPNFKFLPILPFVFLCLHLSYGCGIWIGLLRRKLPSRGKT